MIKFSCEKALLQNAINVSSRAVAQKSSIPALEGLLLHLDHQLTISGFNMQTGIRTKVSEDVSNINIHSFVAIFKNCNNLLRGIRSIKTRGLAMLANAYENCYKLTRPTNLDVIELSTSLIEKTYYNCLSLKHPPIIPRVTAIETNFAWSAFENCENLEETPVLMFSKINARGMLYAFKNCKNLKKVWYLSTLPLSDKFDNWLTGVAEEGTIILNKNITWNPEDYRNGNYTTNSNGEGVKITWGFPGTPETWPIKYCNPANPTDIRDSREEFLEYGDCMTMEYIQKKPRLKKSQGY